MKKHFMKKVSLGMALALIVGGITVSAAPKMEMKISEKDVERMESSFEKIEDIAERSTEVVDTERIENLKNVVKKAITEENKVLQASEEELHYEDVAVLDIACDDEIYTTITVPIQSENYSLLSNATFVVKNNQVLAYSETLITTDDNNKFVIDNYFNGELLESNHTNIDYISDAEIQQGIDSLNEISEKSTEYIQTRGIGETAGCLAAVLGVNVGVALLIAGTCAASCPAVVPVCVACVSGVFALGGADVAAVVACFGL